MITGKVYLECFGCQMNAFDTEIIESMLVGEGFEVVSDPSLADAIIVNTCSVRENAEKRAVGRLNDLSRHERSVLAVCGCMAVRLGSRLFDLVSGLDIIAGTDSYHKLPSALRDAMDGNVKCTLLERDSSVTYGLRSALGSSPSRFLSITRGCETFCSYCIVPYVRGRVRSKDQEVIIEEIGMLERSGAKEVTLLGQNVMAYASDGRGFVDLLKNILSRTSIPRLRFLTTHPRDVDRRIFALMAEEPRICPHLHLPIQSGSDRILERMKRGYSRRMYLEIVEAARSMAPEIALSTDVIVGFPGENEVDFRMTMDLVEYVRFDSAFTFKYSPREGTEAYCMDDDVPPDIKKNRLEILNASINRIRGEELSRCTGTEAEILLDAHVKKGDYHFLKGRTPSFRNVLVPAKDSKPGEFMNVILEELSNNTFIGREITGR